MKKGVAHIFAILILAAVLSFGSITLAALQRTHQLIKDKVLSEKSGGGDSDSHGGDPGSHGSDSGSSGSSSGSSSSGPGGSSLNSSSSSSGKSSSKTQTTSNAPISTPRATAPKTEDKNKKENEKQKIKTKIKTEGLKIEFEQEGDKIVTKIKNEKEEEVELEPNDANELIKEAENELEDNDLKIATTSGQLAIIHNGRRANSSFPLSINPQTGQLSVTTPAGTKNVAVLPDQAVQNILGNRVSEIESIDLENANNAATYKVKGLKNKRLFGLLPVTTAVEVQVSAESGQITRTHQSFFDRLVTLLSI